jgi:hypothetical protein
MAAYRNTTTGEIRDLDDALIAAWQAAGNPKAAQWETYTPPPPPDPPPPGPDYVAFYGSLLSSDAYASVLQQSMASSSPALATLIAVFVSAIGEAMAGRANPPALQQAVWLLLGNVSASSADVAELQGLLVANNLDGIYSLQPPTP